MDADPLLDRVLDDEGLTADLDEAEATQLLRALTDQVRALAAGTADPDTGRRRTDQLCRAAREIARRVSTASPGDRAAVLGRLLATWPE